MKTIFFFLAGFCLPVLSVVSQTVSHPVIEKVEAWYKPESSDTDTSYSVESSDIKVKATVYVTLNNSSQATKIYMKVKDEQTQALVYDVDYAIQSGDVISQGVVLYKKQGNVLSIINPAIIVLKLYVYELYTENATGVKSSVYTVIQ